MLIIKVGDRKGDLEKALKVFKNKFRKTKVMDEIRERKQFDKPSTKKRIAKRKAIYIQQKYRQED